MFADSRDSAIGYLEEPSFETGIPGQNKFLRNTLFVSGEVCVH